KLLKKKAADKTLIRLMNMIIFTFSSHKISHPVTCFFVFGIHSLFNNCRMRTLLILFAAIVYSQTENPLEKNFERFHGKDNYCYC
ncbi:hypothetical protein PENTCL1PPCAC_3624, partial [Pristionchus entomophagus]